LQFFQEVVSTTLPSKAPLHRNESKTLEKITRPKEMKIDRLKNNNAEEHDLEHGECLKSVFREKRDLKKHKLNFTQE
jgi:hypothetical protein